MNFSNQLTCFFAKMLNTLSLSCSAFGLPRALTTRCLGSYDT